MKRVGLLGAGVVMFVIGSGLLGMKGGAFVPFNPAFGAEQPFEKRDHSAETRSEVETLLKTLPAESAATLRARQIEKEQAEIARQQAQTAQVARQQDEASARQVKMWGEFIKIGLVLGAILAVWILPAALIAKAADRRGRNGAAFFLLSLILSPLLMGLIVACMKVEQKRTLNPTH